MTTLAAAPGAAPLAPELLDWAHGLPCEDFLPWNVTMTNPSHDTPPNRVDPADDDNVAFWCERFGVTVTQVLKAVLAVGQDPAAVKEHFLNQGSSAGAS
jgi:Protein of unknown function (DUF3606)